VLTALLAVGGGRALAHAQLLEVTPGNDEVVDTAPSEVTLRFSEPVSLTGGSARVLDDQARLVSLDPVLRDDTIVIPLDTGLAQGTYTIAYEVVSADSHRVSGASVFHIGVRSAAGAVTIGSAGTEAGWGVRLGGVVFSAVAYAGLLVAGGIVALAGYGERSRSWLHRPPAGGPLGFWWDQVAVRAAVLGAVAMLAATPLRIARIGGGLDALSDNDLIRDALRGPIGRSTALVVLALFALAVSISVRAPRLVTGACAVAAAVGFALEGHTRAERRWVMTGFDVVHLLAGAVWLGGVVGLVIAFRADVEPPRLARIVRRFSTAATGAVVVLTAAGVVMAWIILPGWGEVLGTGWGLALVVKVAVVAATVAVGAYNNRRLVPALDGASAAVASRRLSRSVAVETVLLLGVVAITSVLVTRSPIGASAPPPASGGAPSTTVAPNAVDVTIALSDGGTAQLLMSPGTVGRNDVELIVRDDEGRIVNPIDPPTVSLRQPELDIGPLEPTLSPRYIGDYEASVDLSFPGDWDLTVKVRVSDFESATGSTTVTLADG